MGKKTRAILRSLIWGSADKNPYANDEIRREMGGIVDLDIDDDTDDERTGGLFSNRNGEEEELNNDDPYDEIAKTNPQLAAVLRYYDCEEIIPFCERIMWLGNVKEALGKIPDNFRIDWDEIRGLVILQEEVSKKIQHDQLESRREAESARASMQTAQISSGRFSR